MSQEDSANRVIFAFEWQRRRALRRAWMTVIIAGLLAALFIALGLWRDLDTEQQPLLRLGRMVAVFVGAMFAIRAVFNLGRALFRRTQIAQFSREGFAWQVDNDIQRYRWTQLKAYRKGARTWRFLNIPLRRFGQHRLTMNDGRVFVLHHAIASPEAFEQALDPIIDEVMGQKIASTLRSDQPVRLHKRLIVSKNGLVVLKGRKKIGLKWSVVDVQVRGGQLIVCTATKGGKFKVVQRYPTHAIDNLGGFMELVEATLINHQPERFNIQTVGKPRR